MFRPSTSSLCALAGLACTTAIARSPSPQPTGTTPEVRPSYARPDPGAKLADAPGYPPAPQKNLYADHDFRAKPAPKLEIEEWLSDKPDLKGKTLIIDFWARGAPPAAS